MKSPDPCRHWSTACVLGSTLLGSLWGAGAQSEVPPVVPPRAERVEEAPPRAERVEEEAKPAKPSKPAGRPTRVKSPEDDLFDFCELLMGKGDHLLALRQYQEYLKVFPRGKHMEEARFKIGEASYRAGAWDAAIAEFDGYLRDFPSGRNRAIVLYHAGEAHRSAAGKLVIAEERAARIQIAEDAYRATLQVTKTGPYAAYAAFRLASFAYNAAAAKPERYKEASRWFALAAAQAPKEQVAIRYASLFFKGRSSRFLGVPAEAVRAFEELVRVKVGNDYYEKALTELASLDVEGGRPEEAMKKFELLAKESAAAETRAEAMVNAGMIDAEAGRGAEAIRRFEEASRVVGAPLAQVRARYGLVFAYFKEQAYAKVVEAWRGIGDYSGLDSNTRARLLLIAGTAYASTDEHARAAEVFGILEETLPERDEALEGGYKRLVSLFKLNDPRLPDLAKAYVERWTERKGESAFLDKAWLVRAAYYFNRSVWEQAAEAYQRVRVEKLEPEKAATYLYQRGSAEASQGDKGAVGTLSTFVEKNPADERVPMALLQRGLASLKGEDFVSAGKDFTRVRDQYAQSEGAESAAYHAGKVKGLQQDYPGMVAEFERFLKDFPKTKVAAEAWYWIGTGLFQQQKFKDCVDPLRRAREQDTKAYYTDSTLMIIGALTSQKDLDALMPEVDGYLKGTQEKKISPDILRWLGRTVFLERQDYRAASRYLSPVVNYEDPGSTAAELWATLGESQVENGSYESGLVALDHQLAAEERAPAKVKAQLLKARACFALGKVEEATKCAEAGLDLDKETLLSAQLRLVLGDIALASNRPNEAISSYGLVMQNWEDPALTPLAMTKLIAAYRKSGEPGHAPKLAAVERDLAKRFPRYQAPTP